MTLKTEHRTSRKRGCGCGSGGCTGSCEQRCAPPAATTCGDCTEQGFSRPRFFAGQLLTEEDLQAAVDYVVGKRRLTNRHLFGDGVVCGLRVGRDPCEPARTLTVSPGHALDCCGNDIVVPCPEELDILAMIRDLRTSQRGVDCGDPCGKGAQDAVLAEERESVQKYDLFVRYCESLTEPVSAYVTGDACSQTTCEATRIHEGYVFELRCHSEPEPGRDLFQNASDCFEQHKRLEAALQSNGSRLLALKSAVDGSQAYGSVLAREGLDPARRARASTLLVELEQADQVAKADLTEELAVKHAHLAREAASLGVSARLAKNSAELSGSDEFKRLAKSGYRLAERVFVKAESTLGEGSSPVDRSMLELVKRGLGKVQGEAPIAATPETHALAAGLPLNADAVADVLKDGRELLELAKSSFAVAPPPADLTLLKRLMQMETRHLELRQEEFTGERLQQVADTGADLVELLLKLVIDCFCREIPPPCPPCCDPVVKLACIEVLECEVLRICNLCRTFVLSFPNLRYWIPTLNDIGEMLEELCCEPCVRNPVQDQVHDEREIAVRFQDTRVQAQVLTSLVKVGPAAGKSRLMDVGPLGAAAARPLLNSAQLLRDLGGRDLSLGLAASDGARTLLRTVSERVAAGSLVGARGADLGAAAWMAEAARAPAIDRARTTEPGASADGGQTADAEAIRAVVLEELARLSATNLLRGAGKEITPAAPTKPKPGLAAPKKPSRRKPK